MKVLDLFSGLGGWSQAFKDRGHCVTTLDIDKKFKPTICIDILKINPGYLKGYKPDIILASPPCNCFSVASIRYHWVDGKPKDEQTKTAIDIVNRTLFIIKCCNPKWWAMENPRGMLRTVIGKPQYEVTYCQYGMKIMKPTDIWGVLPDEFIPKRCKPGSSCHERAMRGSRHGTQGIVKNDFYNHNRASELRAVVPYELSMDICLACEHKLNINGSNQNI